MRRPVGIWIIILIQTLMCLAMVQNLAELMRAGDTGIANMVRPEFLIGVPTILGLLSAAWCLFAFRMSPAAVAVAICYILAFCFVAALCVFAPDRVVHRVYADTIYIRPTMFAGWLIVLGGLAIWTRMLIRTDK